MPANRIVVVGAGMMGQGLAEAISTAGNEVILLDRTGEMAKQGLEKIGESIDLAISRWAMTKSDKKAILSRIITSDDINITREAGIIIEAIPEEFGQKNELFRKLDIICPPETIFITNTATLSVSQLASVTKRPDRFIGMHFLNPVPQVPLVEIIRGDKTSDSTYNRAYDFAGMLGKTPIPAKEYPGHITTRIIVPLLNEAMNVLMEGVATADDIDKAMKLGYGFNMGPLAMADRIGLDLVLCWMENLSTATGQKCHPCSLLKNMVNSGDLGVKTGLGFYKYNKDGSRLPNEKIAAYIKGTVR
jgi:3-hydroxybutyryl-CoA dehydrogenase